MSVSFAARSVVAFECSSDNACRRLWTVARSVDEEEPEVSDEKFWVRELARGISWPTRVSFPGDILHIATSSFKLLLQRAHFITERPLHVSVRSSIAIRLLHPLPEILHLDL
jgi:hypothetical protein